MTMGVLMGIYVPLNLYVRDEDCFSSMFQLADGLLQYHKYFDGKEFTNQVYFNLAASGLTYAINLVQTTKTCFAQYDDEQTTNWLDNFMSKHPVLRGDMNFETADLFKLLPITIYSLLTRSNWGNGYYWYQKGLYPVRTLSLIFVLVVKVF